MGASLTYLEKPKTDVDIVEGENGDYKFAAAGMQGWRLNQVRIPDMSTYHSIIGRCPHRIFGFQ